MSTTLTVKLSNDLVTTLNHQGVYAYAVTYDKNGQVGSPVTIVDGKTATPTVNSTVTIDLPSIVNAGKVYFIIQSVAPGNSSGLFDGPTPVITQQSDINWTNAAASDFRFDSFEVSLLGQGSDQGNLTDLNVFGIPMSIGISYPNGTTQTRGYAVNGAAIVTDIGSTTSAGLVETFSQGPLKDANVFRLAAGPATAVATGGPSGGASKTDWLPYVNALGASSNATDIEIAGFFNGGPSVDYVSSNGKAYSYNEYHNPGFYAYTASWVPDGGGAQTGTLVLTPLKGHSQVQGTIKISSLDLANSIYSTLGNATISNDGANYQFSSLNNQGQVVVNSDMNTGANNQWGASFVKLLTGFIGGYLGGTATPLNPLTGTTPVDLNKNWNFDPTFAFGGPGAGHPGAVTAFTIPATYGTGVSFDQYAQIFFNNANSYGNGYSDALTSLLQQGGPLIPTGFADSLANNPLASYAGSLGNAPLQTFQATLAGATPLASYAGTLGGAPLASASGSTLVTVTDANAGNYASVGASVSLTGATAFANFTAPQLNQTFKITKVIDATHYQINVGVAATSSVSGGGSGIAIGTNVVTVTDSNAANYVAGGQVTLAGASGFGGFTSAQLNTLLSIGKVVDLTHYQLIVPNALATNATSGGGSNVTAGANVITVTDSNAAKYAAVGGYVSFSGGIASVGGIAPGFLTSPLPIVKIVDTTHYQVLVAGQTATSSASGGGSGVIVDSSAIVVTDSNASAYASVGTAVSLAGAQVFGGIASSALNTTFAITKLIDTTHYQVDLNKATATAAATGGGNAVIAGANVQNITLTLFDDHQTANQQQTLAQTQGYTSKAIYDTYDSSVGPLVAPLSAPAGSALGALVVNAGVGQMRLDPGATVTFSYYTGQPNGLATFQNVTLGTSQSTPLYETWVWTPQYQLANSNPFQAKSGSSTITVTDPNALQFHSGDQVEFTNLSGSTFGGNVLLSDISNQTFTISNVTATTYQFNISHTASSNGSGGGSAVNNVGHTPFFAPSGGIVPTGQTFQFNGVPFATGVNWYRLTVGNGPVSREYNMYLDAVAGSGILNPQYTGVDQSKAIAVDDLASVTGAGTSQYLTSLNLGLFNGGTVSMDPALMSQITDSTIIAGNSTTFFLPPSAPVLGYQPSGVFVNWGGSNHLGAPNTNLNDVTTASLMFGWQGADSAWVTYDAVNGTGSAISTYTNKIGALNSAHISFLTGSGLTGHDPMKPVAADIDGKWVTSLGQFSNGTYHAVLTEFSGNTPVNNPSSFLAFTVNVPTSSFANTGGNYLQLAPGGADGNWIQLHTNGSSLPNGTLLAYATDANGNLLDRSTHAITTDLTKAVLGQIGFVTFDDGTPMGRGDQSVFLPVGEQLHFAIQTGDNRIELLPNALISGASSLNVSVSGAFGTLNLSATVNNTLSSDDSLGNSQRTADKAWYYLTQGDALHLDVKGGSYDLNTIHMVRFDVDPGTGAMSVGGVAYGNTDAFRAAVQANWDPNVGLGGGRGPWQASADWTVTQGSGFYAPVLANEKGNIFVIGDANVDGREHVRIYGSTMVGFEDRVNGDFDYNDAVMKISHT